MGPTEPTRPVGGLFRRRYNRVIIPRPRGEVKPRSVRERVLYRFGNESAPSSCGFIRKAVPPMTRIQAQSGLVAFLAPSLSPERRRSLLADRPHDQPWRGVEVGIRG